MSQDTHNNTIDIGYKEQIRLHLPIKTNGIVLYPILMRHYDDFVACKDSVATRISTLPARYLSYDFLTAIFLLEKEHVKETGNPIGILSRIMRLFFLSLRIDNGNEALQRSIYVKGHGDDEVISHIVVKQDGEETIITPSVFSQIIRPIIADQNGILLPDEADNSDILRSEEEKAKFAQRGELSVRYDLSDLIASVAYQSHLREQDISEWSVLEFENRRKAIERDKRYMLYSQAEMTGMVSFKGGNPYKSWCFDVIDESHGTKSMEAVGRAIGQF